MVRMNELRGKFLRWTLPLFSLLILAQLVMAQCKNDGICTLEEYTAKCPDCVIHNVTYPNITTAPNHTGLPWLLIAIGVVFVLVLLVVLAIAIYWYLKKKKGAIKR